MEKMSRHNVWLSHRISIVIILALPIAASQFFLTLLGQHQKLIKTPWGLNPEPFTHEIYVRKFFVTLYYGDKLLHLRETTCDWLYLLPDVHAPRSNKYREISNVEYCNE